MPEASAAQALGLLAARCSKEAGLRDRAVAAFRRAAAPLFTRKVMVPAAKVETPFVNAVASGEYGVGPGRLSPFLSHWTGEPLPAGLSAPDEYSHLLHWANPTTPPPTVHPATNLPAALRERLVRIADRGVNAKQTRDQLRWSFTHPQQPLMRIPGAGLEHLMIRDGSFVSPMERLDRVLRRTTERYNRSLPPVAVRRFSPGRTAASLGAMAAVAAGGAGVVAQPVPSGTPAAAPSAPARESLAPLMAESVMPRASIAPTIARAGAGMPEGMGPIVVRVPPPDPPPAASPPPGGVDWRIPAALGLGGLGAYGLYRYLRPRDDKDRRRYGG